MTKCLRVICEICSKGFEYPYLLKPHQTGINSKCIIPEKLEVGEVEPDFYDDDDVDEHVDNRDAIFKSSNSSSQEVNEKKNKNIRMSIL